ncbi:FAD dependent oxidoreductase [Meredithblackwellia eburnea MCA 4105]
MQPSSTPTGKSAIVVGAGVFGLSTALYLARDYGFEVDVFDEQRYDLNHYSPIRADCDAASADLNKIVRASYGGYKNGPTYQKLAFEAMDLWDAWTNELASAPEGSFGSGLTSKDRLFTRCGFLRLQPTAALTPSEAETMENMTRIGKRDTHYWLDNEEDNIRGAENGLLDRMRPFPKGTCEHAVLDTTSGVVLADKCCAFALQLAKRAGVRFHFGSAHKLTSIVYTDAAESKVAGITTASGASHRADFTILACGGWTPSLLPGSLDGLLEATAGSVAVLEVPRHLRAKYSAENFPVWGALELGGDAADCEDLMKEIGGLYGFPATPDGYMKLGYRGTKFTHFPGDSPVSVPCTVRSNPPETRIPVSAFKVMENLLVKYMPDIAAAGIKLVATRLCWYTDSVDNDFLIDHVPGKEGLIVASGGSGHGFKFLPLIGREVAAVILNKPTDATHVFAWRDPVRPGEAPRNGLGEGRDGPRELSKMDVTNVVPASLRSKL